METEISTNTSTRLGICEVCGFRDARYACPKCEVKTCSLKCVKIHKLELECDGFRDRTKFVPLNKFTNFDLSGDYRLLEEISRNVETVKKNFRQNYSYSNKNTRLYGLRNAANQRQTTIKFLPDKFARHRVNSSHVHFKSNIIYWHIEWVFVNSNVQKIYDQKISENEKLGTVLSKHLIKQEVPELQEKLQYYQSAGISGLKLFLKAEQKSGKKFYELDPTMTIKEGLRKKIIIEYPTIHVVFKDHSYGYCVIDSDDEESNNGNDVVNKIIKKSESDENLYKSLKNLLFISEYSEEEMSE
ncbi:box C/D snoRNA protein 1 [Cylas formicarius]|uniref:box C/D snoRNA protein 1 n=1 Tax=Cylas formicarius TaxID=197179 RepID=UPI002958C8AE|nr:box C/D snoRNA protein 1 [Cylas formicarius]